MTTAIVIFAVTYLTIAGRPLPFLHHDRPGAALCGAIAMVVFGVLPLEGAYQAIDLDVITLLLGMMIIAAYLTDARFFRHSAWWVLTRAGSARSLLWALVFVAGGLSAVLVNDTICLMMTPLVLAVVTEAGLPPLPYLFALASAANIGGVVTFTGNPQNMIVGALAAGDPSYLEYLVRALPAGALCLALDAALLTWMFRKELPRGPLAERAPPRPYLDRPLAAKAIGALIVFVVLAASGYSLPGAAIACAAVLSLAAARPMRPILAQVDWPLLLFFAGLFVVVAGLSHSGAIEEWTRELVPLFGRGDLAGDLAFIGLVILGSNLVSNVPLVMLAGHWVPAMPDPSWGYILLAVASTLAGNLTLFGSVANIIVFEGAGPRGDIGFLRFLKHGAVLTGATLAAALAVLYLERLLF
ncbi:MAG TPA: SLC13 family permease [Kofleriaceae bacterium]|jgi:Na+/H+ antiporter NhaD/arsenite permease-like protein